MFVSLKLYVYHFCLSNIRRLKKSRKWAYFNTVLLQDLNQSPVIWALFVFSSLPVINDYQKKKGFYSYFSFFIRKVIIRRDQFNAKYANRARLYSSKIQKEKLPILSLYIWLQIMFFFLFLHLCRSIICVVLGLLFQAERKILPEEQNSIRPTVRSSLH